MLNKLINRLNDLRPRQLLMLAIGLGVVMFIAIYTAMSIFQENEAAKQAEQKVQTVQVVVAKVNIPSRTRIQETMLQLKEIPVDIAPEGAIKSFKDVLDVQVKVSIFAGDILTIQKVFAEKSDEGFIATIPLDSRAVSISVNDITSVAGFAKPGDFVDLLLVEKSQFSATTTVILQNVQLLSINKDMTGTNVATDAGVTTTTAINNPSIATFALRPDDVLKLVSASKLGEIYMSLRPSKPRNMYVGETEYTIESINAPKPEPEPEPASAPAESSLPAIPSSGMAPAMPLPQLPAAPATPKIEIIQGDQITQEAETPMPSAPTSLPVIPSGVQANVPSPPVVSGRSAQNFQSNAADSIQDTALSNSRVAQSFSMNN